MLHVDNCIAATPPPVIHSSHMSCRSFNVIYRDFQYIGYAHGTLIVILREHVQNSHAKVQAKSAPEFEIWQVLDMQQTVKCLRFLSALHSMDQTVTGSIAVILEEGNGVLLVPTSKFTKPAAHCGHKAFHSSAKRSLSRKDSNSAIMKQSIRYTNKVEMSLNPYYIRSHLHLNAEVWYKSSRWKAEDVNLRLVEWAEHGRELYLIGVGEFISVWKVVDDEVQLYLQRSFDLCGVPKVPHIDGTCGTQCATPAEQQTLLIEHFDVSQDGQYAATADRVDKLVKVWVLHEFNYAGLPIVIFLGCRGPIKSLRWLKNEHNAYKGPEISSLHCAGNSNNYREMLIVFIKDGTITIWREVGMNGIHSFVLWKQILTTNSLMDTNSPQESREPGDCRNLILHELHIVDHSSRRLRSSSDLGHLSFDKSLLNLQNVLTASSRFYYGCDDINKVRRNELSNQLRMQVISKLNLTLQGDRCGHTEDTHAGEDRIEGNKLLDEASQAFLLCGVSSKGDIILFQLECVSFSGMSPRVSQVLLDSSMRLQLCHAQLLSVSATNYKDGESGLLAFALDIVYRSGEAAAHQSLYCIRLHLHAEARHCKKPIRPLQLDGLNANWPVSSSYYIHSTDIRSVCKAVFEIDQKSIASLSSIGRNPSPLTCIASSSGSALSIAKCSSTGMKLEKLEFASETFTKSTPLCFVSQFTCIQDFGLLFYINDEDHLLRASQLSSKDVALCYGSSEYRTLSPSKQCPLSPHSQMIATHDVKIHEIWEDQEQNAGNKSSHCASVRKMMVIPACDSLKEALCDTLHSDDDACDVFLIMAWLEEENSLHIWVFRIYLEFPSSQNVSREKVLALTLLQKQNLPIPSGKWIHCSPNPFMEPYESMICSFDEAYNYGVWKVCITETKLELALIYTTPLDLSCLHSLGSFGQESQEVFNDSSSMLHVWKTDKAETYKLLEMECSQEGHLALLFETVTAVECGADPALQHIWIFGLLDTSLEACIPIPLKQHGRIVSIQWLEGALQDPLYDHNSSERNRLAEGSSSHAQKLLIVASHTLGILHKSITAGHECGLTRAWTLLWSVSVSTLLIEKATLLKNRPLVCVALKNGTAVLFDLWNVKFAPDMHLLSNESKIPRGMPNASTGSVHPVSLYHPIYLFFYMSRGSWKAVNIILRHIETQFVDHREDCFLSMTGDCGLKELEDLSIVQALKSHIYSDAGEPHKTDLEDRSLVYTETSPLAAGSEATKDAQQASKYHYVVAPSSQDDRADLLFMPRDSIVEPILSTHQTLRPTSPLEGPHFQDFFDEFASNFLFLQPTERRILQQLVKGIQHQLLWEFDPARAKDEAAIRFCASLAWPFASDGWKKEIRKSERTAPMSQKLHGFMQDAQSSAEVLSEDGLVAEQIAWALVTYQQTALIDECFGFGGRSNTSQFCKSMNWTLFKQWRLPFWVRDLKHLLLGLEKAAQHEYATTKDPFAVALPYILLGKRVLLANLFKFAQESRLYELLQRDFEQERWQNAAIKNAHVLKSKQRYELAAMFFLLGKKVEEAIYVAQNADPTLVTSFLIARIADRWSFTQKDGRHTSCMVASSNGNTISSQATTGISLRFLSSTVWDRADKCGDVYMCFIVKYLTSDVSSVHAIRCFLKSSEKTMRCFFRCGCKSHPDRRTTASYDQQEFDQSSSFLLYWHSVCVSLLGACNLARFVATEEGPFSQPLQEVILLLQARSMHRLRSMNLPIMALYLQKDFVSIAKRSGPHFRTLIQANKQAAKSVIMNQEMEFLAIKLYRYLSNISHDGVAKLKDVCYKAILNEKLHVLSELEGKMDTLSEFFDDGSHDTKNVDHEKLIMAVIRNLALSRRHVIVECIMSSWMRNPGKQFIQSSCIDMAMIPQLLDRMTHDIAFIAHGDLAKASTKDQIENRIDQVSLHLLLNANELIRWLLTVFADANDPNVLHTEYIRTVTAVIYSVICLCARYVRCPSCMWRCLQVVFPHKDQIPFNELEDASLRNCCEKCDKASHCSFWKATSLQDGVLALQKVTDMLIINCRSFIESVESCNMHTKRKGMADVENASRMERLLTPSSAAHTYSFCSYWVMLLSFAASEMREHVVKITALNGRRKNFAQEDYSEVDNELAQRVLQSASQLLSVWNVLHNNLSHYVAPQILLEMVEMHAEGLLPNELTDSKQLRIEGLCLETKDANILGADNRANEALFGCVCVKCPWRQLLSMFVNVEELLHRLHALVETCNDLIREEIEWGYLPELMLFRQNNMTKSQSFTATPSNVSPSVNPLAALNTSDKSYSNDPFAKNSPSHAADSHYTAKKPIECVYRGDKAIKDFCLNLAGSGEMVCIIGKVLSRAVCTDAKDGESNYIMKQTFSNPFCDSSMPSSPTQNIALKKMAAFNWKSSKAARIIQRDTWTNSPISSGRSSASQTLVAQAITSQKAQNWKPTAVVAHPYLNAFVSGDQQGKLRLWAFDRPRFHCEFQKCATHEDTASLGSQVRDDIKMIRFDNLGHQMAAVDMAGFLHLWNVPHLTSNPSYRAILCHDKGSRALTFMNSSSCLATAGNTSNKKNVCVWDTLLPTSKIAIASPTCHPGGATSVLFSSRHQLLISGGEGGGINIFDVRQRRFLYSLSNAHETAITTLALHPDNHSVLSGSAGGDVKIWSIPIFREVKAFTKIHTKASFLGDGVSSLLGDAASNMAINVSNASWGVTAAIATGECFLTCGTDGSVHQIRVPNLGQL